MRTITTYVTWDDGTKSKEYVREFLNDDAAALFKRYVTDALFIIVRDRGSVQTVDEDISSENEAASDSSDEEIDVEK